MRTRRPPWAWRLLGLDGLVLALSGLWLAFFGPHQIERQEHYRILYERRSQAGRWIHDVHQASALAFALLAIGLGIAVVVRASKDGRGRVVVSSLVLVATVGVAMWSARDLRWNSYTIDPSARHYEDARSITSTYAGGTTSTSLVASPGVRIPSVVPFGHGTPDRGIWDVAHDPRIAEVHTLGGKLAHAEYRQRTEAHLIAATLCVLDALGLVVLALRSSRRL